MKKVKLLKNLPGVKAGNFYDLNYPFYIGYVLIQDDYMINEMINDKWLKLFLFTSNNEIIPKPRKGKLTRKVG